MWLRNGQEIEFAINETAGESEDWGMLLDTYCWELVLPSGYSTLPTL